MDIESFVKETLVQIQHGVQNAIAQFMREDYKGGQISPAFEKDGHVDWEAYRQNVEFDLAVTVSDKDKKDGKIGANLSVVGVGFNAGGDVTRTIENSSVNRIKFTISMLPATTVVRIEPPPTEKAAG